MKLAWVAGLLGGSLALAALGQVPCIASPQQYNLGVRARAVAIRDAIAGNRAAYQRERRTLNTRFGQQPKPSLELFGKDGGRFVGDAAEVARTVGISPELLLAALNQEGLDGLILTQSPADPIDGFGALGVDGFASDMAMLKREGFLRPDYAGTEPLSGIDGLVDKDGAVNADPSKNGYWVNEAGQKYRAFYFKDFKSAAEGVAAYLRYKQSLFLRDARALGIDTANMDSLTLAGWSYLYYNAGEGLGRRILQSRRGRIPAYNPRQGAAIRNANRIMAAITQFRSRDLLPDPSAVAPCGTRNAPVAGVGTSRNANTVAAPGASPAGTAQPAGTAIPAGWSQ